ncbi:hypothetical protein [Calothrix sp. FACHB-168]|uniref:hypothetical protein n=1 Tax=Calothrix sp. FACHB-168 TaxID=2692780 RepID=UPI00198C65C7|nr:hypothetical protein [Calothrix sp. FACHB-168]MBD2206116.1 hypothetical protein [Calothrix sp. FACHB-168]
MPKAVYAYALIIKSNCLIEYTNRSPFPIPFFDEVRASGHGSASAPTINDYLYLTNLQSAVIANC